MHTLLIFAFCNVDDVTWGTKGLGDVGGKKKYYKQKVGFVGTWLAGNVFAAWLFITLNEAFSNRGYVVYIIGGYASLISFFKITLGTFNHL